MKSQQAVMNRVWSRLILEELSRLGVRDVCVAPGSRSTPLTLEADAHSALRLHRHFDERGLGYLALGLAKASHQPVAVIVTSGTAVANLLPCVVEANLTGEKLVLLTADRPVELVDCGANQAIEQPGIFAAHVAQAVNLPSPTTAIAPNWLLTTLDQALFVQARRGGAVHINCPFPEPLYIPEQDEVIDDAVYLAGVLPWLAKREPYIIKQSEPQLPQPSDPTLFCQRGVVIIGSLTLAEAEQAKAFAQRLGWPVFCDPQSGVSSDWAYFDIWLHHRTAQQVLSECDVIVQFGGQLVSKRLNQWLQQHVMQHGSHYLLISPDEKRNNPSHLPQQQIVAPIETWVDAQIERNQAQTVGSSAGWADTLLPLIGRIPAVVQQVAQSTASISELDVGRSVATLAPAADLFFGNSLMVRLVDMFGKVAHQNVYSNRGASGIDGLVATAAGVQQARQQPMLLMLGDTSLLYDLNSLALLTNTPQPFVIVVTNNDGGAIFDLLPVPQQQKTDLYQMPHGYDFQHAAAQFGLRYAKPESVSALTDCVAQHFEHGKHGLIVEVRVPAGQAAQHIQQVIQHVCTL
ncbi:2-succinyl-5-enolpyruvyl-6-hydroxy-3-cyclohexene-1-carboxylic-acid synthase [Vibrio gazogenes]|uniref:2-succinyl-5-enolpyruvyl-6-hydroxy-3-cyclohexene-1-carboxylate synthase n=1 Tax=Vibrio gazogenes DSM 21264 = NBRC 103151 TaxID=1123492 RepID=A0A1M5FZF4_VIBGA|nr:2-succinyl-5-enolpyruvyl-6-hydroxy-3-cyclohexene-1-carboxylic-acid synthase [Vibrio gazogenes]USP14701.1 2-succinyl-5-enolpyruvyl-6-hydroxy-3-cyclohexene-1-carboxylic-acid synthase [Vibrio gazogenes]SHF96542.1 2-succinyl-5-enolpyruvyl-6-hydroxy-3-cyclohexene-1-carboxylate synthase [Vibrio gazogenes DSM 21264] [Vibrio gazogenes DSM 21264 = NBRC 103151]SJN52925.1 2-succinyl-5-enolpyruvyl-6-hydroxy-3-cyclohexene-1-carboxylate synthase [Vibrio gazogenes]